MEEGVSHVDRVAILAIGEPKRAGTKSAYAWKCLEQRRDRGSSFNLKRRAVLERLTHLHGLLFAFASRRERVLTHHKVHIFVLRDVTGRNG